MADRTVAILGGGRALVAPGVFPALGILGPALEARSTIAPAVGAFQVIAIDKPPADG